MTESEGRTLTTENTGSAREVFAELYEQYMPGVYRYINYRVGNIHLTEDLTSSVFEKPLTGFRRYQSDRASFFTWLMSIARHVVIDHYRTKGKRKDMPLEEASDIPSYNLSPEQEAVKREDFLILLKLRKTRSGSGRLTLQASYEDRNGNPDSSQTTVELEGETPEFFANSGIRKGVLLSRYADLLKNWMIDEREHVYYSLPWEPRIDDRAGIIVPPSLGRWERQSLPLTVSQSYGELFQQFSGYFEQELDSINDNTLEQELKILEKLRRYVSG